MLQFNIKTIRLFLRSFGVVISWLLDSSEPGFDCHKLVTLVLYLNELFLNWLRLLLSSDCFNRQIDIFIKIIKPIVLFFIMPIFIFLIFSSLNIPNNDCSILASDTDHFLTHKLNFCDMRAMAVILFKNLLGNVTWIFENSDRLIIISDC